MCEQTKAVAADLSKYIDQTDFTRKLETEKLQALIASIEKDIHAKKQDVYQIEIKNRYDQLYSIYEQTKKEVAILEKLLPNDRVDKTDAVKIEEANHLHLNEVKSDESLTHAHKDFKDKRLNLRSPTPPVELSQDLDNSDDMLEPITLDTPELAPIAPKVSPPPLKTEIQKPFEANEQNLLPIENKSKRFLGIVLNVIFYFIAIFSTVFVVLFGTQNPQAIPRDVMGFSVMRVASDRMEPNIPVNSLIVTRKTNPNDLQIGDVVIYGSANHTTLTHRIHEIIEDDALKGREFVLKGDALATTDMKIATGPGIIGRVIFISYPVGRALLFFKNQFLLVIAIVVVMLVIIFAVNAKAKNLGKKSKKDCEQY